MNKRPMASIFHPAVARWFDARFPGPTPPQERGWAHIQAGRDTLIAAPTGSGKTLAAFLVCLDELVRQGTAGTLGDHTQVVYVSPLKALGNDIQKNLVEPLAGIADAAFELGLDLPAIRTAVRSGDTPQGERQKMLRKPPHLLITTPESLYLLLTSVRGRQLLSPVHTVIVDEIHALADDKRGAHLSLSLERLEALCQRKLRRIGLSATQNPIEEVARFLVGAGHVDPGGTPACAIVDETRARKLDLALEIPRSELQAVASKELWGETYDRIAELAREHRTTLVFVNTRRLVERVAHALGERLGEDAVAAHHGSLSREKRLAAEQRLKTAQVKLAVATASLELGIDVGAVELVCQVGSPRSLSVGLQRIGRSGHWRGATPKGRLFPMTRDELLECAAFVRGIRRGRLDELEVLRHPLDILAQQIVAAGACETLAEDDLYALVRRAWPYRELSRRDFDRVVAMVSEGAAPGRSRAGLLLHRDGVNHVVKARRGARLTALTSGGAIPDTASYAVVAEPENVQVGSLDEDFAIESMSGDIFLLGNTSWRILRVESGTVRVADAQGAPPTIPFWNGEAPGRTFELSEEVSRLREDIEPRLPDPAGAALWLAEEGAVPLPGAEQAVAYLATAVQALGALPSHHTLVAERFFDEAGGMQLIVHAPFGTRINRAFGLALRKRFCMSFDFELQAAATDDGVLLSLGPQHSFPLETIFEYVTPQTATKLVTAAALRAPMFQVRFRWDANRALLLLRHQGGRRVPPQIQRMRADDLMAAIFPAQVACQENPAGPLEPPDHPLIDEVLHDCLHEAMDLDGLTGMLTRLEAGEIRTIARDLPEPSPLSHEILSSHPYTFLDDAPLEERRARAVSTRRTLPTDARELGALDPEAIAAVAREAWPEPRDADELHEVLLSLGFLPADWAEPPWRGWFAELASAGRAGTLEVGGREAWVATERRELARGAASDDDAALDQVTRGWMECLGPTTAAALAACLGLPRDRIEAALARVEAGGAILRGHFRPGATDTEYCERGLLARIHRLTLGRLRREIEPVSSADLLRFLTRWQRAAPGTQLHGVQGLREVIGQLQGFPVAAGAWERDVLPARVAKYEPGWLDQLCLSGEVAWGRLAPPGGEGEPGRRQGPTRAAPVSLVLREDLPWLLAAARAEAKPPVLGAAAAALREVLARHGASFLGELAALTGRIPTELEQALWELTAAGEVTCDGFGGLRGLIAPRKRDRRPVGLGGRWSLFAPSLEGGRDRFLEPLARLYLRRYGVVFRDLVIREPTCPPWRELLPIYRQLEARGELRGGRFVAGHAGEQFALPAAVDLLRSVRRQEGGAEVLELSAADPLNLTSVLDPGPRVPAVLGNRVRLRGGAPERSEGAARREPGPVAYA
ncbi:MAG TPA: DEAD/DEAH box helicase [Myxococcales bacterium]|nr:DEAD/DEAH box helicase [Myxococcales bacterium]